MEKLEKVFGAQLPEMMNCTWLIQTVVYYFLSVIIPVTLQGWTKPPLAPKGLSNSVCSSARRGRNSPCVPCWHPSDSSQRSEMSITSNDEWWKQKKWQVSCLYVCTSCLPSPVCVCVCVGGGVAVMLAVFGEGHVSLMCSFGFSISMLNLCNAASWPGFQLA